MFTEKTGDFVNLRIIHLQDSGLGYQVAHKYRVVTTSAQIDVVETACVRSSMQQPHCQLSCWWAHLLQGSEVNEIRRRRKKPLEIRSSDKRKVVGRRTMNHKAWLAISVYVNRHPSCGIVGHAGNIAR